MCVLDSLRKCQDGFTRSYRLGVIPGYGGTQRLPQLVGKGRAMEMIMTAGMVTAQDAYRIGLVQSQKLNF
jgi:enoyl-CoA hydratase/carnithine racemase